MTVFFTSDTHFSHTRIVEMAKRPFSSVEEMDEALIERWNEKVRPHDIVYHLGDFTLAGINTAEPILNRLNGMIRLVRGNHDREAVVRLPRWDRVVNYLEARIEGHDMTLCHYAMRVWHRSHKGALMLYGHSHGNLSGTSQSLDVGVDSWNFAPVTIDEILARMATLPAYVSGDHHVRKEGAKVGSPL